MSSPRDRIVLELKPDILTCVGNETHLKELLWSNPGVLYYVEP